ncbi:hypothetical protein HOE04_05525 [archaeon]|jgi:hypothetical protein|nr:hypothetical protein [archaeon]
MDVNEVLAKYSRRIEGEMNDYDSVGVEESSSVDYNKFKNEMMPEMSRYEKWTRSLGNIVKIKLAKKDEVKFAKHLSAAHLDVTPSEAVSFAGISFMLVLFFGIFSSVGFWLLGSDFPNSPFPFLYLGLMFVVSMFLFYYFYSMPKRMAVKWRLKASSQMVPAILYTVIYMKHTSNLERAISFVSQHIEEPLALDLRKVLWDLETGKFSSIRDSLDSYLEFWKETNMEFVESFHLIESSLYEPDENRRVIILERALRVILDGVYERMLKYTHTIKAPLTNLYMLGIVLPTLGLALLPLASALLGGLIKWTHVFLLFNLIIPFFVYYMTLQVMLKRPGGYGESSLLEKNPLYYKYVSKKPYLIAGLICVPFFLIGLIPLVFGYTPVPEWLGMQSDYTFAEVGLGFLGDGELFQFEQGENGKVGPFGFIALLMSLFIPFSISMFFALSFSMRTKELIKSRNDTKDLEGEFNSSLFTLGNRLGDGTPAEIVFAKVAESVRGQKTEDFFRIVNSNIQSMGMSLEDAIFNPRRGALVYYPSNLIATSMRILIESVKKGLKVAAQSLMSISEYVRNMQKINERLRDLLADVVSDMKSNMTFLAPLLAGIVVGLASMITGILGQLKYMLDFGGGEDALGGLAGLGNITQLFELVNMIPPYFLQIAIGVYIIQVVFILTGTLVTIDAGEDKLRQTNIIAKNLIRGGMLYLATALLSILAMYGLARVALGGIGG